MNRKREKELSILYEKYGADELINVLNEYEWGGTSFTTKHDFKQTGGHYQKGAKGLAKSLPSFFLTTILSWPTTLLMLFGALNSRFHQRWEKKDGIMERIGDPRYWSEYIANVNDGSTGLFKHRSKDKADASAGHYDFSSGSGSGSGLGAPDSSMSPEDRYRMLESGAFRWYWVTLSNQEVIRVYANNESDAKTLCNNMITENSKPGSMYDRYDRKLADPDGILYRATFTDGEIYLFGFGYNDEEATRQALVLSKGIADSTTMRRDSSMPRPRVEYPSVESLEPFSEKKFPRPEYNKFLRITDVKPSRRTRSKMKHIYNNGSLVEYSASHSKFKIVLGATHNHEAVAMIQHIFGHNREFKKVFENLMKDMHNPYEVKMGDGDNYIIPAGSANEASEIAKKLQVEKIMTIAENIDGKSKLILKKIFELYPSATNVVSVNDLYDTMYDTTKKRKKSSLTVYDFKDFKTVTLKKYDKTVEKEEREISKIPIE